MTSVWLPAFAFVDCVSQARVASDKRVTGNNTKESDKLNVRPLAQEIKFSRRAVTSLACESAAAEDQVIAG